ncbi:MAG: ATP-binding cassette domain-containing protein [Steroidobacteraceae bacterium]
MRGPSGSGKSTLSAPVGRCCCRNGHGAPVRRGARRRLSGSCRDRLRGEQLGFVFQMFNLIPYLSVLENVLLPLQFSPARAQRLAGREPRQEARRLLATLGLRDEALLARSVTQLSIGQQQRVAAARALLGRPGLVIADEPTSSLDMDAREAFLRLLMDECREQGAALLFVSHDTSLGPLFDRVVSLADINACAQQAAD